jgi:adenylosuccinate lyase
MAQVFSPDTKFRTWRSLWIALAEAEMELGLDVTNEQIAEMKRFRDQVNYRDAEERERETFHDVMSHVYAFGLQCPKAKPIIHLGATSCFVGDNTDLIQMRDALKLVARGIAAAAGALADFAVEWKARPTLAFTHFQPAQLTTVGKRAALWLQDLMMDLAEVERLIDEMPFRGVKGTTGTQASFLALFDGDHEKVKRLDRLVAEKMGFARTIDLSSQTYPRKIDHLVLSALSSVAQSASKFSGDMRLLAHMKEIEEPFGKKQIGSSAMAYKRNPLRSERISSLARYVISMSANAAHTAAAQWFERTLDDSANRRLSIPEAFLAVDVILRAYHYVAAGLVVNEEVIAADVARELPFMATENILMAAVKAGGDRQELHELIRVESHKAAAKVKAGGANDLVENLSAAMEKAGLKVEMENLTDPAAYTGRSAEQVVEYVEGVARERLAKYDVSGGPEQPTV